MKKLWGWWWEKKKEKWDGRINSNLLKISVSQSTISFYHLYRFRTTSHDIPFTRWERDDEMVDLWDRYNKSTIFHLINHHLITISYHHLSSRHGNEEFEAYVNIFGERWDHEMVVDEIKIYIWSTYQHLPSHLTFIYHLPSHKTSTISHSTIIIISSVIIYHHLISHI